MEKKELRKNMVNSEKLEITSTICIHSISQQISIEDLPYIRLATVLATIRILCCPYPRETGNLLGKLWCIQRTRLLYGPINHVVQVYLELKGCSQYNK